MSHSLCIETICVENRQLKNVAYHEARLHKTRSDLWGLTDSWKLTDLTVPAWVTNDRHKLRIAYGREIEDIRWELHVPRMIRSIKTVNDDQVDYAYKYNDRSKLNALFDQRGECDEILIIKKGMVSDSFFFNVAFFDGIKWLTPDTNLLPGTQRANLLHTGVIEEASITAKQIRDFSHIRLFNALIDWERAPELTIDLVK
jgi:4-amino-4-deoxychorismate lyase